MRKSSRVGRIYQKPTNARKRALHTSKATLVLTERCKGGLRLTYAMPNGRPRTYRVTFG